ncbi:MAG TPA: mannonate dehydratase [Candidatus Acidoferrales bacterium]|nr:mannonate dehydratase [Candidatus Acidoferrales bacterium]
MKPRISRRNLIQGAGLAALATPAPDAAAAAMPGPRFEGKDTPKICLAIGDGGGPPPPPDAQGGRGRGAINQETAARRLKQLGVDYALSGGPQIPWEEGRLKDMMDRLKNNGVTLGNLMIGGFNDAIYNRPGKDEQIQKVIQSIRVAGKVGLPVVEYNWYAHRAMEGYFEETGRAGVGWTGFDYELEQTAAQQYQTRPDEKGLKFKDLPALPEEGAHTLDEMWTNIAYFLKAVIPEAEKAGVRLALHPNDPPAPISRKSQQIMGTVEGWKKLIDIVKSPSNGITFDCGVTREMGQDPVEVCRYFASRDRINHVHFRNVKVIKPYERYTEVFIDEGENNMFAIMKELVKAKYTHLVYPEHPRAIDYDRDRGRIGGYPGGGGYAAFAFNVGYARAMMQAALTG